VLNLEPCIAITHNVVTTQNLLPVVDFLEQASISCQPGEGCRGSIKFNFSGDVPTSVIYPYPEELLKKKKEEDEDEVAITSSSSSVQQERGDGGGGMCACSLEQFKLLNNFQQGLARDHPGLLESLYEKRDAAKKPWWDKGGVVETAKETKDGVADVAEKEGAGEGVPKVAEFSFGFSFS
jgi:hypothetical protein